MGGNSEGVALLSYFFHIFGILFFCKDISELANVVFTQRCASKMKKKMFNNATPSLFAENRQGVALLNINFTFFDAHLVVNTTFASSLMSLQKNKI